MHSTTALSRRDALRRFAAAGAFACARGNAAAERAVQTVTGPAPIAELGVTLMHEHIVTDLSAPAERKPGDYNRDEAVEVALPYLEALREAGCQTLVEPTPISIGRDPRALRRLAKLSGLKIVAATGIYGAAGGKFIPDYARSETAEQLAGRYTREANEGMESSEVRPGIIKTGVNPKTPLPEIERKLVTAAALAGKATGLAVASHMGLGPPALEQLSIFEDCGVPSSAFIWVHAQNEKDHRLHFRVAQLGAWVEFDGISPGSIDWHVECVRAMAEAGLLSRTLISQDAGWYRPGEPGGGRFREYTFLFTDFLPRLRKSDLGDAEIRQLLVDNPARALAGARG